MINNFHSIIKNTIGINTIKMSAYRTKKLTELPNNVWQCSPLKNICICPFKRKKEIKLLKKKS